MKNIAGLLMLTMLVFACSSTKRDLNSSGQHIPARENNGSAVATTSLGESHASLNSPATASPVYASSSKAITFQENNAPARVVAVGIDNQQDELLSQKVTLAQMEMFRQIEMDRAVSSIGLKKVMQQKIYTTAVRTVGDSLSSSIIVSQDTVYSAPEKEKGEWRHLE